jgi:hypothetical protein
MLPASSGTEHDPRGGRPRAALAALAAALLVAACSWGVPADPGVWAQRTMPPASAAPSGFATAGSPGGPGATADADPGARSVYLQKCGQCHVPFSPTHASPARWPSLVRHYGPRAGLFGAERERVVRWLQANAGR